MVKRSKNIFGIVDNVATKYSTSRMGESHTKMVHLPPAFNGEIRIDDVLEPSQHILMTFKGPHGTFYLGIHSIRFYKDDGDQITSYKNVAVNGQTVDNDKRMPVIPSNDGWTASGNEHSVLFDFGRDVHVAFVSIQCIYGPSTPKEIYFTDGMVLTEQSENLKYAKNSCIQLGGEPKPVGETRFRLPSILASKKNDLHVSQLIEHLNANPPARGFQSFLSGDGKDVFAFYQQGCRTRACDYFFGSDPVKTFKLVNSYVKRKIETVIENDVKRAMTLKELQVIRAVIVSECHKKKWKSSREGKTILTPDHVNMHDLYANMIRAITKKSRCSMKEILASGIECSPSYYYVSHSWGQSVLDLIQCCEQHAVMNNLSCTEATYWISSFALRENEFGAGFNLAKSSFNKAIEKAKGLLLVSDPEITVANRVWVLYELFQAMNLSKTVDISIYHEGTLQIDAECDFPHETKYQHRAREQHFPTKTLMEKFLAVDLRNGETSHNADKVRILNTLCGREDCLDDRSILSSTSEESTKLLNSINSTLRGAMARRAVVKAVTTDGQSIQDYFGMNLIEIIKSGNLKCLKYDQLQSLDNVSDEDVIALVDTLSSRTEEFQLNVNNCSSLTDACIKGIKFPTTLKRLELDIGKGQNISNESICTLAEAIPSNLERLAFDISGYKNPNGSYHPRFNDHLNAISSAISGSGLMEFELNTSLDDNDESLGALLDLATSLSVNLKKLSLTLRWQGNTGELLPAFVANLPYSIHDLSITVKGGCYVEESQLSALRHECRKLKELKLFQLTTYDDGKRGFYVVRNFDSLDEMNAFCS